MCGITGIIDFSGRSNISAAVIENMTQSLFHRGPDSSGYYVRNEIGLGIRRLSIVDIDGGDQPLFNETKSLVMICNGEIFNHHELRERLKQQGHEFRTNCDVEVIIHAYEQYGLDMLNIVKGQFALCIYDISKREVIIARDKIGINPMYYSIDNAAVIFGSEIKSILESDRIRPNLDVDGLDQCLTFPGLISPKTMFENIQSLPPGYFLKIRNQETSLKQYWDMEYPDTDYGYLKKPSEYIDLLDSNLVTAIDQRLQGEVPVGLYLSGGLDSSLIGGKLRQGRSSLKIPTFSIQFGEEHSGEGTYQKLMSTWIRSEHHECMAGLSDIEQYLSLAVRHSECPLKESYNAASLILSKRAKSEGVSVILAGEGADELFAGYVGYRFDSRKAVSNDLIDLDAALEQEVRAQWWGDEGLFYERNYLDFRDIKASLFSASIVDQLTCAGWDEDPGIDKARLRNKHPIHQRSYLDFKLRLADHLLTDHGDRMAMAHSVEARYPFIDTDVVDVVRQLPPTLLVKDYVEKYVLRSIAEPLLPPQITTREKFPFTSHGSPHLVRGGSPLIDEYLNSDRVRREGYFNPKTIEMLLARYASPDFVIKTPFEDDLIMFALTFGIFKEQFGIDDRGS